MHFFSSLFVIACVMADWTGTLFLNRVMKFLSGLVSSKPVRCCCRAARSYTRVPFSLRTENCCYICLNRGVAQQLQVGAIALYGFTCKGRDKLLSWNLVILFYDHIRFISQRTSTVKIVTKPTGAKIGVKVMRFDDLFLRKVGSVSYIFFII